MAMRARGEEDEAEAARALRAPERAPRVNPADEAMERYERELAADPDNPANARTMIALANLYLQQRQDYARAAQWYREYLNRNNNPDDPQTGVTYAQLLRCYEAMEDSDLIISLCREMIRVFPPERQEYIYADKFLRGQDLNERIPLPVEPEGETPEGAQAIEGEAAPAAAEGESSAPAPVPEDTPAPAEPAPALP